jgi:ribosomal protein L44E
VKACPACSHVGDETYCPECRKHGRVSLMRDKRGLENMLENLRKQAHFIKAAISNLDDD